MPRPSRRSRSLRRVHIRVPSGVSKLFYKKRKPQKAKCGECGAVLQGVARERPTKMQNITKSQKRPERKYGGVLCPSCTKRKIIAETRSK